LYSFIYIQLIESGRPFLKLQMAYGWPPCCTTQSA